MRIWHMPRDPHSQQCCIALHCRTVYGFVQGTLLRVAGSCGATTGQAIKVVALDLP